MEMKDTLSSCSNSEEQQMQQIQEKAKESCMVSFRQLHSHLKHLSHDNLKGTRIESGFKRAFTTLFGQDVENFLLLKFSRHSYRCSSSHGFIGIMNMLTYMQTNFLQYIDSKFRIPDTLNPEHESVKKSHDAKSTTKREYGHWVNERRCQTTEISLIRKSIVECYLVLNTESIGTEFKEHDTSTDQE
ncbi:hypothetical protein Tco_0546204 [Tanacetum coccineum]